MQNSTDFSQSTVCSPETYLLIEELARLLLDGVNELYLSCRETHQQGYALRRSCEVVEVVTGGLRPLVDALVYGLTQVSSLAEENSDSEFRGAKVINVNFTEEDKRP